MPTEHIPPAACEQPSTSPPGQIKLCASCHRALSEPVSSLFVPLPDVEASLCALCREHATSSHVMPSHRGYCAEIDSELAPPLRAPEESICFQELHPQSLHSHTRTNITHSPKQQHRPSRIDSVHYSDHAPTQPLHVFPSPHYRQTASSDPLLDITRLRVRTQRHHCLYPGATFQGLQKSGRNSYEVSVTIQNVDFSTSFLCGYLRIHGLTDDWPELTTYFDAEIIGPHHGFLTQKWGANDADDMLHWSRFPAFRHVKNELRKPRLTMDDRDRGAVFMRWKERFLVPDPHVTDINGASFAGIYYVCIDFNAASPAYGSSDHEMMADDPVSAKHASSRSETSTATLSGYYWHAASEPYQQLLLNHIPERSFSSFEFR